MKKEQKTKQKYKYKEKNHTRAWIFQIKRENHLQQKIIYILITG